MVLVDRERGSHALPLESQSHQRGALMPVPVGDGLTASLAPILCRGEALASPRQRTKTISASRVLGDHGNEAERNDRNETFLLARIASSAWRARCAGAPALDLL